MYRVFMVSRSIRKKSPIVLASSLLFAAMLPATSISAAPAPCSLSAPSIGDRVVCAGGSQDVITIPTGAAVVQIDALGAGGGAGSGGGAGGTGARVVTEINVLGESFISIETGSAGGAGLGGSFTAVYRGSSRVSSNALVVAGGGGGGETGGVGTGGNGAATNTEAGGNGTTSNPDLANKGGGADGSGNGGAAGEHCGVAQTPGSAWSSGGAGGAGLAGVGGSGGSGYGGGGGGANAGGGAGGSFVDSSVVNGAASFSPAGGASGVGGYITFTFYSSSQLASPASPVTAQVEMVSLSWAGMQTTTEAARNSWVQIPDSTQVSKPGYRLLGWSTTADFSENIAQRQVDRGWGVYEVFDETGRITAVFIPAGGHAFLTGDASLHPIWASGELVMRC